jgi:hypothetical protein
VQANTTSVIDRATPKMGDDHSKPQLQRPIFPPMPPYASSGYEEYTKPPLPSDTFVLFGETHSKQPGIPPLHVQTEFAKVDGKIIVKDELQKLYKRLSQAIEDLLATLVDDPQSYARRVEHCGLLFRNVQYLINILREKQATDLTLVDLLRHKIREKQECLVALTDECTGS